MARQELQKNEKAQLQQLMNDSSLECRQLELLSAKGASAWLTTLPLKAYDFWLCKRDFRDGLALHYNWTLEDVPVRCACGAAFAPDHAMVCPFDGYPTIRRNELRDLMGNLLSEVRPDVAIERRLTPLNGETFEQS